jgi:sigma-E factor negative regulatory protein RseC
MIEERATVVSVEAGFAWVETQRTSTCGSCSANKGCGTGVVAKVVGQRLSRVRAINTIGAHVGDEIVIGLHDQALVRGSLAVYAAPLIAMLLMAMVGDLIGGELQLSSNEGLTVIFGLAGLGLGFLWVRRFSLRIADDVRYQPVILRQSQVTPVSLVLVRL